MTSRPWFASGRRGVVVAAFPDAAAIGAAMLRAGGNAVDAACAAAWALAVCEPAESGLGGQATALVRDPQGRAYVIDGHSRAPHSATRKHITPRQQRSGCRSTTVPTVPATLALLQRRFGKLSQAEAIAPSADLAARGYALTSLQRRQITWTREILNECPIAGRVFLIDGSAPAVGTVIRQPELALTLARLAERGVEDFYSGETAAAIVRDMAVHDGLIDKEDLARVAPRETEPIEIEWGGRRVLSVPPPGGGVQVLLALRLLERFGANRVNDAMSVADHERARAQMIRAAFRERERWPDHPDDLTPAIHRWLVSAERADRLQPFMDLRPLAGLPPDSMGEMGDTTHLCAADQEGWVVSLTQSIQSVFGAKVMCAGAGFFYNNFLKTCPRRSHPYRLKSAGLPQSNAAPTLVLERDGERWSPALALGASGSRRLTTALVQILDAVFAHGVALPEAIRAPRLHALMKQGVWVEKPTLQHVDRPSLEHAFGPIRVLPTLSYKAGAAQAIAFQRDGVMLGVADPRRDGIAVAL